MCNYLIIQMNNCFHCILTPSHTRMHARTHAQLTECEKQLESSKFETEPNLSLDCDNFVGWIHNHICVNI